MKRREIGLVTITYSATGKVVKAQFEPKLQIDFTNDLKAQMKPVDPKDDGDSIKANADLVLASWFSAVNDIELSDRSVERIVSKVLKCERYASGQVMLCQVEYAIETI